MHGKKDYHDLIRTDVLELALSTCNAILDLGGGKGESGAYLKKTTSAETLVLIDILEHEAKMEIDHFHCFDLNNTERIAAVGQDHGPFDTILCLDVLEHLIDPWGTVTVLSDMLSKDGVIVASIPNMRHYHLWFPLLFCGKFELKDNGLLDRTHLRWFTKSSMIELFDTGSLEVDLIKRKIYGWKARLLNVITLGVFRDFLSLQYYIRVKRH